MLADKIDKFLKAVSLATADTSGPKYEVMREEIVAEFKALEDRLAAVESRKTLTLPDKPKK